MLGGYAALASAYSAWLLGKGDTYVPARDLWLFAFLLLAAAGLVIARGLLVGPDSTAWLLLGVGMTVWAVSDAYYTGVVAQLEEPPYPSLADWGYLVLFPFAYASLVLLLRSRIVTPPLGVWLDGLLVALGVGAFLSLLLPTISHGLGGSPAEFLVGIATPGSDLLLACLLAGVLGLLGLRAGTVWWLLLGGAVTLWATDSVWLLEMATEDYNVGAELDLGWLISFALFALAAWRLPVDRVRVVEDNAWSTLPLLVAVCCFTLIIAASQVDLLLFTVAMAAAAVVVGVWRTAMAVRRASVKAEVRRHAYLDDLTGLPNRRKLLVQLGRTDVPAGVLLLLDVDGFKQVNDSLGHAAGDDVLRTLAPRLTDTLRADDLVARLGGDQFAVFLAGTHDLPEAVEVAERLRRSAARPMRVHGVDLQVDLSVGIALSPQHGRTLEQLLQACYAAIHRAKHSRSGAMVFEPGLDPVGGGHLIFLQELRRALASDEVFCVYQPKIELKSGSAEGVEALVRWRHPEHGVLGPGSFLEFAEQTTLIKPLTERVLHLAVAQLGEWLGAGMRLTMSVNLSAMNLLDPRLPGLVGDLLSLHRIPPGHLTLEVTESMFLTDPVRAKATIDAVRQLGVVISIDDYGTGFSSLGQVRELPAQELKLDMSFVIGIAQRPELQSIMASSVLLAHGLGLRLVAEGVESAEDLAEVRRLGCDLAQGFHVGRPMEAADVGVWLRRRSMQSAPPAPRSATGRARKLESVDSTGDMDQNKIA